MFRAGRPPDERYQAPGPVTAEDAGALFTGPFTLLADVSEFQPDITDPVYLRDFSQAIIIRAMYGDAWTDHAWYGGARRMNLLDGGARFLGIYQYIRAGQDAAAQARALAQLLGKLHPGEKIIADIEEGSGSQRARWDTWASVIRGELGDDPWDYSGLWFAQSAGLSPVDWVAAYQSAEPGVIHKLWQFTDALAIPGIGSCDCSVYHGPIDQLAALAYGGKPVPVPTPVPVPSGWTEHLMSELPVLGLNSAGEDVKTVQGLLCARGHVVAIDGAYGPVTRSAVTAFQHAAGFTGADLDGTVGPKTWPKLLRR